MLLQYSPPKQLAWGLVCVCLCNVSTQLLTGQLGNWKMMGGPDLSQSLNQKRRCQRGVQLEPLGSWHHLRTSSFLASLACPPTADEWRAGEGDGCGRRHRSLCERMAVRNPSIKFLQVIYFYCYITVCMNAHWGSPPLGLSFNSNIFTSSAWENNTNMFFGIMKTEWTASVLPAAFRRSSEQWFF